MVFNIMKKVLAIRFLIISPDLKLVVRAVFMSFVPKTCRLFPGVLMLLVFVTIFDHILFE